MRDIRGRNSGIDGERRGCPPKDSRGKSADAVSVNIPPTNNDAERQWVSTFQTLQERIQRRRADQFNQ